MSLGLINTGAWTGLAKKFGEDWLAREGEATSADLIGVAAGAAVTLGANMF
jgi:hypothetical protein